MTLQQTDRRVADVPEEARAGKQRYLQVISGIQRKLQPRLYLEIGVRTGKSLATAVGNAVGVDPEFCVTFELPAPTRIYKMPSDDFFATKAEMALDAPLDLAFIDGLHFFEFALRDFINIERRANATSIVLVDDIFPNHPAQAERERRTVCWTGDVWKLVDCLRRHRPDLCLVELDTKPTGLLLILGLSPASRVLAERYDDIVAEYSDARHTSPPASVLTRTHGVDPQEPAVWAAIDRLRRAREADCEDVQSILRKLRSALDIVT